MNHGGSWTILLLRTVVMSGTEPRERMGEHVVLMVLIGVLVLVVLGCACVVWSRLGGPPWTRKVAAVTLATGSVTRAFGKSRGGSRGGGDGD
ncbi:hypothetical protein [Streptomyces sp. NPDC001985]|uniref:hypothetical protein n=1 Tax=Streptomyces sp. NPDC001985 TaxID=3154406 RepID=UPI003334974E